MFGRTVLFGTDHPHHFLSALDFFTRSHFPGHNLKVLTATLLFSSAIEMVQPFFSRMASIEGLLGNLLGGAFGAAVAALSVRSIGGLQSRVPLGPQIGCDLNPIRTLPINQPVLILWSDGYVCQDIRREATVTQWLAKRRLGSDRTVANDVRPTHWMLHPELPPDFAA